MNKSCLMIIIGILEQCIMLEQSEDNNHTSKMNVVDILK